MDANEQVHDVFERLRLISKGERRSSFWLERFIYSLVYARCEADINGFASVFEQGLNQEELGQLIDGLRRIGEPSLADDFAHVLEALSRDHFYEDGHAGLASEATTQLIEEAGRRVGSNLWGFDERLAALLNAASTSHERNQQK